MVKAQFTPFTRITSVTGILGITYNPKLRSLRLSARPKQYSNMSSTHYQQEDPLATTIREAFNNISRAVISAPLVNLKAPEFSGNKDEDVIEWLNQFDLVTFSVPEDQRKKLLGCAFKKSARAWFKDDLEPLLENLDWSGIKSKILARFKPRQEDYYIERLKSLNYSQENYNSLGSYVDQRVHVERQAYPQKSPKDIVKSTLLSLTPQVRSYLNLLKDTSTIDKIEDLKALVSRYDEQIHLPQVTTTAQPLDKSTFETLIKSAIDEAVKNLKETHVAAAIAVESKQRGNEQDYHNSRFSRETRFARNNNYQRKPQYHETNTNQNSEHVGCACNCHHINHQKQVQHDNRRQNQPKKKPPYPCRYCGESHWNNDCPKRDLKPQGC